MVSQSQVSSNLGANLVLNVFTGSVDFEVDEIKCHCLLLFSCECPGKQICILGKVNVGCGNLVLYGLLKISDLYADFLLSLHIILCKT